MNYDGAKFQKQTRVTNKKLLREIAGRPCLACGHPPPSDPAHYVSRGAGGDDSEDNVFPLCRVHHQEQHRIGIKTFTEKYAAIKRWRKEVEK